MAVAGCCTCMQHTVAVAVAVAVYMGACWHQVRRHADVCLHKHLALAGCSGW